MRRVEAFISTMEEKRWIRDVVSTVGASKRETAIFKASVAVYLKEDPERPSTQSVADKIRPFLATLEGVETTTTATRVGFGNPIEIRVNGDDLLTLYTVAEEIHGHGHKA